MDLRGAVVAVTGASRGIGEAVAVAMAARGARVGLIARSADDLARVLGAVGGSERAATAVADVGDRAAVGAALESVAAELGPVDVLVANAGIGQYGAFADTPVEEIEQLLRVNVLGTVHAVQAVLPSMLDRRRGHIVTMGSIAGLIGTPFEAAYAASKFAQVGLTEAMAVELAPHGIGVSIVNPGPVATAFGEARGHPYDRARPKPVPASAVADAVVKAVEREKLEVYVPRSFRPAVVVRHLLPGLFRRGAAASMRKELAADLAARRATGS